MGSVVRVRYDEDNFLLYFSQDGYPGFSLPEGYLGEFVQLIQGYTKPEYFYQNYYIAKTAQTVKILRTRQQEETVIELTHKGAEKLLTVLRTSNLI